MSLVSFLADYEEKIESTDMLGESEHLVTFGLFGEVGSVLAISKKSERDGAGFNVNYSLVEELGDVLWYFARLCKRCGWSINNVSHGFIKGRSFQIAPTGINSYPIAMVPSQCELDSVEVSRELGAAASTLLSVPISAVTQDMLSAFFKSYLEFISISKVKFQDVVDFNLKKTLGRFTSMQDEELLDFDIYEHEDEQLPRHFEIEVTQRSNGRSYMKKGGVFIGDPLTDNIMVEDHYRFHDVFHMSYAAILHWSPVFRSLLKNKRKGNPLKDEAEDGGRAIVIEEGVSAWLFSIAKENNYFEGQKRISFDVLKTVKQFVRGYEVEKCPYGLFERAILEGYSVFRDLKKYKKGVIVGDRKMRTIQFKPEVMV
ncbi:nucleoside triphosphate pyrophosphohydrolase family protein [Pseudomonas soli]|uniref:Pyrophosphatase n=1 Tax=Pseudomonas soli TaxID=1306993 RepID=A0A2V4IM02_9PSED|nr:nucleoside triphosphate pyrophosphohydrolase family protein [Pseudomonas soli]PYB84090.1 pyrophosphatase [Pseudomonas soli]